MFESARLKIERANHHLFDLQTTFGEYAATKPHRFSVHHSVEHGVPVIRVNFSGDMPQTLPLIIGDTIHNARTALDHMTWDAIGLDDGTQNRYLTFPTGDNRINYESRCEGIVTPSDWVKRLFISLEAFPGGKGDGLYSLTELDNSDKHITLSPAIRATRLPNFTIIQPDGRRSRFTGASFSAGQDAFADLMILHPGQSVELDENAECAPTIFFANSEGPPQPIVPTLKQFIELVSGVINVFETAFRGNN